MMLQLIFSILVQHFSSYLESRKPTLPIEALIEFFVHELVSKVCLKRFSGSKVSLCEILCSWRQMTSTWYFSAKYAISYFLDMESNALALKVLIRNGVLILLNFSALPLATSDLMLQGGSNARPLLLSGRTISNAVIAESCAGT